MSDKLIAKREELAAKQAKLAGIFAAAKQADGTYDFKADGVEGLDGDAAGRLDQVRKMNDELDKLGAEVKSLAELREMHESAEAAAEAASRPASKGLHPRQDRREAPIMKSLGMMIAESDIVTKRSRNAVVELPEGVGIKTLMETSAGWAPENIRSGKLVESAQRPVQVLDLIPGATTNQSAVVYMEETTFTNNAAEAAEGAAFGEGALALTEVTSPVRKIAVFLPVTDEQLEDVPSVQSYINNRLTFMLRQRLDSQVLVGDGTAPNLSGILDRSGLQTQALGADPVPDAIHKAITKVRVTGRGMPDAVVLHSNDWQGIRLLRTTDGIYIWGSPSEAGPASIWGLPVVISEALTEGTGLVGDFRNFSQLSIRRNVTVKVSDSHDDYFVKGKQAIRADLRASLEVFRPAAFCSVTGI